MDDNFNRVGISRLLAHSNQVCIDAIAAAKEEWNGKADEFNQWDSLSEGEQEDLMSEQLLKGKPNCHPHMFACPCREALFMRAMKTQRKAVEWSTKSAEQMRLQMGELTANEIRVIRAAVHNILS